MKHKKDYFAVEKREATNNEKEGEGKRQGGERQTETVIEESGV